MKEQPFHSLPIMKNKNKKAGKKNEEKTKRRVRRKNETTINSYKQQHDIKPRTWNHTPRRGLQL